MTVYSPVSGTAVALSSVPDPVFAEAMVGPGLALEPHGDIVEVRAPVAGRITHAMAHAVVIAAAGSPAILVHLGVDTLSQHGAFRSYVEVGSSVEIGDLLISWDLALMGTRSLLIPVVALQCEKVTDTAQGPVGVGEVLFRVP